jgi:hypothetical protein
LQTNYDLYTKPAVKGMAGTAEMGNVISKSATEDIEFGLAVVQGSKDNEASLIVDVDSEFLGVAKREQNVSGMAEATSSVNILTKGTIWVEVTEDVSINDVAYAHTGTGNFCKTAAGNLPAGGVFRTTTSTGQLAILELNNPNKY